jgi:hypothetical protein
MAGLQIFSFNVAGTGVYHALDGPDMQTKPASESNASNAFACSKKLKNNHEIK